MLLRILNLDTLDLLLAQVDLDRQSCFRDHAPSCFGQLDVPVKAIVIELDFLSVCHGFNQNLKELVVWLLRELQPEDVVKV